MNACNGCHTCKLVYEEAADNSYLISHKVAVTDNKPGCLKPNATVAEKRAAGDSWVPPDYMDAARKYGAGMPTAVVNQMLRW
jgi:hypothetical protein